MFNEHVGMETATLNGSKIRISRILKLPKSFKGTDVCGFHKYTNMHGYWSTSLYDEDERDIDGSYVPLRYSEGEIVSVAQRYKDIFSMGWKSELNGNEAGWYNKMFVKAEYMPHQIQITDIKLERLQDISDEDCIKEGITLLKDDSSINMKYYGSDKRSLNVLGNSPREVFAVLIDKINGKGTWNKNPWIVAYYYELVK